MSFEWTALSRQEQAEVALIGAEMAAEVWERGTPADGHRWWTGVGGEVIVPRSIVREAVAIAREHRARWGEEFARSASDEIDFHLRAVVFEEFDLPDALDWALRAGSSLLSGLGRGYGSPSAHDSDPLFLPINQAITACALERRPDGGMSDEDLLAEFVAELRSRWEASSARR
jgi:hypothetical protein